MNSRPVAADPAGSPSNRKRTPPKNGVPQVVGLDRLSVSFPVWAYEASPEAWRTRSIASAGPDSEVRSLMGTVRVDGVTVMVGMQERFFEGVMQARTGKVEYNPSRIVDPEGCSLASLDEASETFPAVMAAAASLVQAEAEVGDYRVTRLDLARDFCGVDEPSTLIRGLASLHRPYARKNLIHADPKRNGAQTVVVGGKQSSVRLYDKHEETKGRDRPALPGTVRWEAECRKGWAENYGDVVRVRDLSVESVGRLAVNRWEWSQMGAEVAGDLARLVERVHSADLTSAQRRGFLGWLVEQAAGLEGVDLSQTTLAKYRRLQRELGIVAPAQMLATVSVLRRLDWDSGREVQRVA